MLGARLFREREEKAAGRSLYASAVAQARTPAFYLAGAPDTPEGRFELYGLHVMLILHRLSGEGARAGEVSQATFDAFLRGLDDGLREMGVGDLSVGKKMRKLGEAFYGRLKSLDTALKALPDITPLEGLISRTVLESKPEAEPTPLACYVAHTSRDLAQQPLEAVCVGEVRWPAFQP